MTNTQGLMPNSKPKTKTPRLDALRTELQPKAAQSLEEQLATLNDIQMQSLTSLRLREANHPKKKRDIGKNLSALMAEVKPT